MVVLIKTDVEDLNKSEENLGEDRIALIYALEQIDTVLRRMSTRSRDIVRQQEAQLIRDNLRRVFDDLCAPTFRFNNKFMDSVEELVRELGIFQLRF